MKRPHILLTNDDGIDSPGLWAAAETLSKIGYVTVAAPRDQSSGAGRSMRGDSDGIIQLREVQVDSKCWKVYAVGGTPAQTVQHAILEIIKAKPDLVVSGINYGENVGVGVTISGTVGAALEAAAFNIPALAISLETNILHHLSYSTTVDFSVAAHFAQYFGELLLKSTMPDDMDVLKVDVPASATMDTAWKVTQLARGRYYELKIPDRASWEEYGSIQYILKEDVSMHPPGTDVYQIRMNKEIAVTPLSLDLTSRINLRDFEGYLTKGSS